MSVRATLLCGLTALTSLTDIASAAPQNVELFGAAFLSGTAYRTDPADAGAVVLGTTGFPNMSAVCKDSAGTVWGHSNFQRKLLTLDPHTGLGVDIVDTFRTVRGMDFAGGTLYAIADGGFNNDDRLYTINTTNGSSTLIGTTSHERIEAFCFVGAQAYAWDQDSGLLTIDITNGNSVNVSGVNDGGYDIQALAVSPNGVLYGAWEELYTINTATGVHTLVEEMLGFSEYDGMTFYSYNDCLDLDVNNLSAGQAATLSTGGIPDGSFVALVFGEQQGTTAINLPPLACASFGIDPTLLNIVDIGAVAGGSFDVTIPIPAALSGALIYFQSAQLFTCPGECLSNLKATIL